MPPVYFDSFRAELEAVRDTLNTIPKKTVRDESFRERVRNLLRVWITSVRAELTSLTKEKRNVLKLAGELQALAALTNKIKSVVEYRKRINRAISLANQIVLWLPVAGTHTSYPTRMKDGLFVEEIPDLPLKLVPNALLGWQENIRSFVRTHSFDRSIFLMIRYRKRNDALVRAIKSRSEKHGYSIVLARDHRLTDDLYNPIACLLCCSRGLAIFDKPEPRQHFNPNVAYELGMMHLLGRDCRVLKHTTLTVLHTDILMKLYADYSNQGTALAHIDEWLSGSV